MRVVERVDRIAEQPRKRERDDDKALGEWLRIATDRFGCNRDQEHGRDNAGDDQQADAVGVGLGGMFADLGRFAGSEQRDT